MLVAFSSVDSIAEVITSFSYAYVEFSEPEHIDAAVALDNSLFRGRLIKVKALQDYNHTILLMLFLSEGDCKTY